ncbi:glucose-6-phosphate isomerase [Sphingomonas sinipercae]|uniref:Glucose-6-phosphate isomerase n=1 Tax=Sphingomonas sinipercae TaxID=2714944 RepID=A0A6G7ZN39_9SPHN|nr:glucose-6-phosphate isomerase [Sphingomonas sinipercae]QIL02345.1 glucose-6-phosphate isomerase [Sphingomonas sinipercae]
MTTSAWTDLSNRGLTPLSTLFEQEPDRLSRLTGEVAGIYFDLSKTHIDAKLVETLPGLAEERGLSAARDALFAGGIVNPTEGRPADHLAERGQGAAGAVDSAAARRERMRALVDAIEAGAFGDITGVLHIGIGGSVLGPALLVDALSGTAPRIDVSFLSNIDGQAFDRAVEVLDPATTLVIAASKTFTTAETLSNLQAAMDWLRGAGIADPQGRVIAVTAAPEAALEAGIDDTRILQFSEGVGGRYSLWSAVSVTAALALGWTAFEELLEGAAEMDRHFRYSEPGKNLALLAALADQLYVQNAGAQSRAVFAYDERLELLPSYLQQLEMESNGKSVSVTGEAVERSAPVTWGGVGTDAQHAVFQLLHQGTALIPVEFVAVAEDESSLPDHHRLLLLNAFAQGAALMRGKPSDDPHRNYAGNRPSITILLDRLDPRTLGALIAFYEHRTFANAVLMGINPFDQFGVELGKEIARKLGEGAEAADLDPSTRALMERAAI